MSLCFSRVLAEIVRCGLLLQPSDTSNWANCSAGAGRLTSFWGLSLSCRALVYFLYPVKVNGRAKPGQFIFISSNSAHVGLLLFHATETAVLSGLSSGKLYQAKQALPISPSSQSLRHPPRHYSIAEPVHCFRLLFDQVLTKAARESRRTRFGRG